MSLINEFINFQSKYNINPTEFLIYKYIKEKIENHNYKILNKEIANIFNFTSKRARELVNSIENKGLIFTYHPTTNKRFIFLSKEQQDNFIKNN